MGLGQRKQPTEFWHVSVVGGDLTQKLFGLRKGVKVFRFRCIGNWRAVTSQRTGHGWVWLGPHSLQATFGPCHWSVWLGRAMPILQIVLYSSQSDHFWTFERKSSTMSIQKSHQTFSRSGSMHSCALLFSSPYSMPSNCPRFRGTVPLLEPNPTFFLSCPSFWPVY